MAFLQKISSGSTISADGKIIYVKDLTGTVGASTYTEDKNNPGVYIQTLNTTGYETPNPARSGVALYLIAYIKGTAGITFLPVKEQAPVSVTDFEVTAGVDGWYAFEMLKFSAITSPDVALYSEGEIVYDKALLKLYKKTAGAWALFTDLNSLKGTAYSVAVSDKPYMVNNTKRKSQLNESKLLELIGEPCNTVKVRKLQEEYDLLSALLEGAFLEFCRGNKYEFQKIIEFLNENKTC